MSNKSSVGTPLPRIDLKSIKEVESEQNGEYGSQNRRDEQAVVLGMSRGQCRRLDLHCLVTGWNWKRTRLAVLRARTELPDLLVAAGKDEINDVRNDGWDIREAVLLTVQEEAHVLAAHDEG